MLTIYTIAYNEEIMLPFMIKWYRERFSDCKIVVYDNYSTDNTEKIALENNCTVIKYDSNNEIRDDLYLEIKNNCWKTANTNWVLVCDVDEFLDINEDDLKNEESIQTTIIKSKGYDIVNLEDNYNIDNMNCGCNNPGYSKNYLFNKLNIEEINYTPGCHTSNPVGKIKYSEKVYNLFHNKYINVDYLIEKHKVYAKRLSNTNKQHGWGNHYFIKETIIREDFLQKRIHCKPIIKINK